MEPPPKLYGLLPLLLFPQQWVFTPEQEITNIQILNSLCGWNFSLPANAFKATAADECCSVCCCPSFLPGLRPWVAVAPAWCALIGLYFLSMGKLPSWSPAKYYLEQVMPLLPTQSFVNRTHGSAFQEGSPSLPLHHLQPPKYLTLPGEPAESQLYITAPQPAGTPSTLWQRNCQG